MATTVESQISCSRSDFIRFKWLPHDSTPTPPTTATNLINIDTWAHHHLPWLFTPISRKEFIKRATLTSACLLLLNWITGCSEIPSPSAISTKDKEMSPETLKALNDATEELIRLQAHETNLQVLGNTTEELDQTTASQITTSLALTTKYGLQPTIEDIWMRSALPDVFITEMQKKGIPFSPTLEAFELRNCNGGHLFFLPQTKSWVRIADINSQNGRILKSSYDVWKTAWATAGLPPETVNSIQTFRHFSLNGEEQIGLVTPGLGMNLESALKTENYNFSPESKIKLLTNYADDVIIPLAKKGVVPPDFNLKNSVMRVPDQPKLGFVPIDLAGPATWAPEDYTQIVAYNQLRNAASKRGINMPTAETHFGYNSITELKLFTLKIPNTQITTRIYLPKSFSEVNGAQLQGENMCNYLNQILEQITNAMKNGRSGETIDFNLVNPVTQQPYSFKMLVPVISQEVPYTGGKLAELAKNADGIIGAGSKLLNYAALLGITMQITEPLTPPDSIKLTADSIPQNVAMGTETDYAQAGKIIMRTTLQQVAKVCDQVVDNKIALDSTKLPPDPYLEAITGKTAIQLKAEIAAGRISQSELIAQISTGFRHAFIPVHMTAEFGRLAIITPTTTQETTGSWTTNYLDDGTILQVLWGEANNGSAQLIPLVAFTSDAKLQDTKATILSSAQISLSLTKQNINGDTNVLFSCQPQVDQQNPQNIFFQCSSTTD